MQLTINQEKKIWRGAEFKKFTGNLDLKNYSVFVMEGAMMEPTIKDGAICLIDKNDRFFYEGGIYLCRIKTDWSDDFVIRRVHIKDYKNLQLKCDNETLHKFACDISHVFPVKEKEDVIIARVVKVLQDI